MRSFGTRILGLRLLGTGLPEFDFVNSPEKNFIIKLVASVSA